MGNDVFAMRPRKNIVKMGLGNMEPQNLVNNDVFAKSPLQNIVKRGVFKRRTMKTCPKRAFWKGPPPRNIVKRDVLEIGFQKHCPFT